jgi:hypothetical protein
MDAIEKARLEQLERCVPDVWNYDPVLYIGAGSYRHHFFDAMKNNLPAGKVDIVEIDQQNFLWCAEHNWLGAVLQADIRDFLKTDFEDKWWNLIIWSHGVETLPKSAGPDIIKKLETIVKKGVIVHMTPFGAAGGTGNVSVWRRGDFETLGYKTDTLGAMDERNSNLLAYKYIK